MLIYKHAFNLLFHEYYFDLKLDAEDGLITTRERESRSCVVYGAVKFNEYISRVIIG